MKKQYLFSAFLGGSLVLLAFQNGHNYSIERYKQQHSHLADTNGPSAGRTGAPGESNCTSCHSGSAQSGSGINTVVMTEGANVVTNYVPGTTYNIAVSMTSSSSKNGFQIVALTSANAQAGTITLIPSTGTQIKNGASGKKYVTHTSTGTAQTAWAFQWTAPASDVGNVTFYLATNETNNNNSDNGDAIYLSQHVFGSAAGMEEQSFNNNLEVIYQKNNNSLSVSYNSLKAGESMINLTDLSGKSVFSETIGDTEIGENTKVVKLPSNPEAGIYLVHLNINNTFVSKKVYIQ